MITNPVVSLFQRLLHLTYVSVSDLRMSVLFFKVTARPLPLIRPILLCNIVLYYLVLPLWTAKFFKRTSHLNNSTTDHIQHPHTSRCTFLTPTFFAVIPFVVVLLQGIPRDVICREPMLRRHWASSPMLQCWGQQWARMLLLWPILLWREIVLQYRHPGML